MENFYRSAKTAVFITSLNRYALIALSIVLWINKGFWSAVIIFCATRLAQYALNFISSAIFVNVKKDLLDNPLESQLQRSWLMVALEMLVLAIAVYVAKFWM
jgi:hypothetical protein